MQEENKESQNTQSQKITPKALPILKYGNPVLRKKALPVESVEQAHVKLAIEMLETMYRSNGIGLAAPQVGVLLRIIVVDVAPNGPDVIKDPYILINPVVIEKAGESTLGEGCLSIPGIYNEVVRPEIITVEALNTDGQKITLSNISGMLARAIQHEIDHLDGLLFVDKLTNTDRGMISGKLKKMSKYYN